MASDRSFYASVPLLPQLTSFDSAGGATGTSPSVASDLEIVVWPGVCVQFEDHGDVWQFVLPSLVERLPLRSITWKNHLQVNKTIDRLYINFRQVYTQAQLLKQPSDVPHATGEAGLVFLFVVKCEDLATYKTKIKPALSAWVDRMNLLKNEWLILYVPLGTQASSTSSAATAVASRGLSAFGQAFRDSSKVYRKVLEKLKTDFGDKTDKIDRICKIEVLEGNTVVGAAPGQQQQHEAQWSELLLKLKACIMEAFDTRCSEYEEQLRLLDAKRALAGWDFSSFLQVKESLALLYIQASLFDDALRHYDELEAIITTMDDQQQEEQYQLPRLDASDLIFSATPFDIDLVAVRMNIAVNAASPMHIRLYLFCRQVATLYLTRDYVAVCERSHVFLPQFLRLLSHPRLHLPESAPLQWAIGAALALAVSCEHEFEQFQVTRPKAEQSPGNLAVPLGELLYFARRMCCKLPPAPARPGRHWYELCLYPEALYEITYWASVHYANAGRLRFAAFLSAECARYYLAQDISIDRAASLLAKQVRQLEADAWHDALEATVEMLVRVHMRNAQPAAAATTCQHWLKLEPTAQRHRRAPGRGLHELWRTALQACDSLGLDGIVRATRSSRLALPTLQLHLKNQFTQDICLQSLRVEIQRHSELSGTEPFVPSLGSTEAATGSSPVVLESTNVVLHGSQVTPVDLNYDGPPLPPGTFVCTEIRGSMDGHEVRIALEGDGPWTFELASEYESTLTVAVASEPLLFVPGGVGHWAVRIDPAADTIDASELVLTASADDKATLCFASDGHELVAACECKPLAVVSASSDKLVLQLPPTSTALDMRVALCAGGSGSATVAAELRYAYRRAGHDGLAYAATAGVRQGVAVGDALQAGSVTCVPTVDKLYICAPLECNKHVPLMIEMRDCELIVDANSGAVDVLRSSLPGMEVPANPNRDLPTMQLLPLARCSLSFVFGVNWDLLAATEMTLRLPYTLEKPRTLALPISLAAVKATARPPKPQWRLTVEVRAAPATDGTVQFGNGDAIEVDVWPTAEEAVATADQRLWIGLAAPSRDHWVCVGKARQVLATRVTFQLQPLQLGPCPAPCFDVQDRAGASSTVVASASPPIVVIEA
ncbi:trafficking protein particle complex subunit 10 [Achlya hypogyna]|uniref:Trafficking protein particle complex subunit 10 n=1 Tax=Achlya hypogyna TaxID=1202772 RepID=A0A1V9ZTR6_ACHHY|nr:trafficking protein particle complex subunit 10 [Achlya hypogyna]